ncbi:NUDIX domain-containing protein [Eubacteriales bacterium OttesenSCG-928-M02]|nr:NUDIX domain-containing protein [Eubacteriales bacterium OttesenSCG-928-M02]
MKREKSCGAVIVKGEKVLLIRHIAGHWGFPKGHMEPGETERETALREIGEETGLTVTLAEGFRYVVNYSPAKDVEKEVVYFFATPTGGAEKMQESELQEMAWFSFSEAEEILTFLNDKNILAAALAFLDGKA